MKIVQQRSLTNNEVAKLSGYYNLIYSTNEGLLTYDQYLNNILNKLITESLLNSYEVTVAFNYILNNRDEIIGLSLSGYGEDVVSLLDNAVNKPLDVFDQSIVREYFLVNREQIIQQSLSRGDVDYLLVSSQYLNYLLEKSLKNRLRKYEQDIIRNYLLNNLEIIIQTNGQQTVNMIEIMIEEPSSKYKPSVIEEKLNEDISIGSSYTHGFILNKNHIYFIGKNIYGKLGSKSGNLKNLTQSIDLNDIEYSDIAKVALGEDHSVILTKSGDVYTVGSNKRGQLGLDSPNSSKFTLVNIPDKIRDIVCGDSFTVALTENGEMYGWGNNDYKQLVTDFKYSYEPRKSDFNNIRQVYCGPSETFILTYDNKLYGVGFNEHGKLGIGRHETIYKPVLIPLPINASEIVDIVCNTYRTLILTKSGTVLLAGKILTDFAGMGTPETAHFVEQDLSHIRKISGTSGNTVFMITDDNKIYVKGKKMVVKLVNKINSISYSDITSWDSDNIIITVTTTGNIYMYVWDADDMQYSEAIELKL